MFYNDGVVNVSFIERNIRLSLARIVGSGKDNLPKHEVDSILVLSIPAFLRLHKQINQMVERLTSEGVLEGLTEKNNLPVTLSISSQEN
jgi:hypothetical protein